MSTGETAHRSPSRYLWLLASLLAIAVLAFTVEDRPWLRVVYLALVGYSLVHSLHMSGERTRAVRTAEVLSMIAVAIAVGEAIADEEIVGGSTTLLAGILLAFVPVTLARRFAHQREVTIETVLGVICIYFVFGLLFAFAYATLDRIGTEPFFASGVRIDSFDYVYFSFVTLTTTGYGDLTAGTTIGRALAISEAFFGQVFLVTIVARLVSLWAPRRSDAAETAETPDT